MTQWKLWWLVFPELGKEVLSNICMWYTLARTGTAFSHVQRKQCVRPDQCASSKPKHSLCRCTRNDRWYYQSCLWCFLMQRWAIWPSYCHMRKTCFPFEWREATLFLFLKPYQPEQCIAWMAFQALCSLTSSLQPPATKHWKFGRFCNITFTIKPSMLCTWCQDHKLYYVLNNTHFLDCYRRIIKKNQVVKQNVYRV